MCCDTGRLFIALFKKKCQFRWEDWVLESRNLTNSLISINNLSSPTDVLCSVCDIKQGDSYFMIFKIGDIYRLLIYKD